VLRYREECRASAWLARSMLAYCGGGDGHGDEKGTSGEE